MKKVHFLAVAVIFCLGMVLLSCASIPPAETREADNTTAKVYFIMPNKGITFSGGGLSFGNKFNIWDSDTFISTIGKREFLMLNFKAGTHFFMASGGNWYIVQAELAAGKSYFFEVITLPGFRTASVALKSIDPNDPELDKYLDVSKEVSPTGKVSESMVKEAAKELSEARGGSQNIDVVPASKGR